jgi:hypothetical protein
MDWMARESRSLVGTGTISRSAYLAQLTFSVGTVTHVLEAQANGVLARGHTLGLLEKGLVQTLFGFPSDT